MLQSAIRCSSRRQVVTTCANRITNRAGAVNTGHGASRFDFVCVRGATKKAGGSTKNGRDSAGRRLGVKRSGGQFVQAGEIIIRQRGQKFRIVKRGETVGMGKDHTIFARTAGHVKFFDNPILKRKFVAVIPADEVERRSSGLENPVHATYVRTLKSELKRRHRLSPDDSAFAKAKIAVREKLSQRGDVESSSILQQSSDRNWTIVYILDIFWEG